MVFQISTICIGRLWLSFARKAGAIELGHYVFLSSKDLKRLRRKSVVNGIG